MQYLNGHEKSHGETKLFKCKICEKEYKTNSNLKDHQNVHHNGDKKPVKCQICDKYFKRVDDLHKHAKKIHSEPECEKSILVH